MNYWLLFTFFVEFTLPRQSPIANRVLHKRQRKLIDVIDRHVMIFLMTYFRTTPMAMMWIMQPANPGLSCRILCCGRTADYFRLQLWTYENICVQYEFVLHCCDVMALCTASQISNKIKFCFVVFGLTLTLLVINTSLTVSCEQQTTPLTATSDECHQLVTVRSSCVYNSWRSDHWQHAMKPDISRELWFLPTSTCIRRATRRVPIGLLP